MDHWSRMFLDAYFTLWSSGCFKNSLSRVKLVYRCLSANHLLCSESCCAVRAGGGPGPVAGVLLPGQRLWGASILFCLLYAGVLCI